MPKFFTAIYLFLDKRRFFSFGLALIALFVLGYLASRISFQENITQLIPSNNQSGITAKVLDQVTFADKITVLFSCKQGGGADDLTDDAGLFIDSVNATCKPFVKKIQGRIEEKNIQETFDFVYNNLPLFLDQNDYRTIDGRMNDDSISHIVGESYKSLMSPTGIVSRDFILKDPLGLSFIALKKFQQLSIGEDFQLQSGFVVTKDKKNLLLFLTPELQANETDKNTLFVERLNSIVNELNRKSIGKISVSYFGATPVAVANATQIKADVRNTSIFAIISLILILTIFYRNLSIPVVIFIPSIFGALFALAVLYLFKGTISAISLGISSVLLGETTDYSIYVLTHLRNNKDVKLLYRDISRPLIICGVTTAVTFLCLFFVKSEALKDLGIFAALSVTATSIFSLVLIPLLYKIKNDDVKKKGNIIDKLGAYPYHKNRYLIISVLVIFIICLFTYSKVTFNSDLSALNYMTPELKKAENDLDKVANISSKSIYLVAFGSDEEKVLEHNNVLFRTLEKDKKDAAILSFSSIGGVVFSRQLQEQKIGDWNKFWDSSKKREVKKELVSNSSKYGFKDNSFAPFYQALDKSYQTISMEEYASVKSLFIDEFTARKNGLFTISTLVKIQNDKRDDFVSRIQKQANIVVLDRKQTNEAFLGSLKDTFLKLVNYSFLAIFLLLLWAFKRIELVIVSIIPVMVSWVFTSGIMGLLGLQFNIINIMVCTLILGIGEDYSIFMTLGLQKEHTYGKKELPTYRTSIILSVTTTIIGIGVLIFAKHPALKSISAIAIVGILSTVLVTFVVQPLVFNFFVTNRVKKGNAPFQLRSLVHGILSFTYYGLGGVVMSLYSVSVMRIIPISEEKKMRSFRYFISKFMKSVLYTNPFVDKKVINYNHEQFEKPAVIIANHTSFLDILAVGMLSPKIIYLVSDWVYNSPVFGAAVRRAGFYPVSEGLEGGIEHLRPKVEQGFSLIIFPEGTRSKSNQIQRFHKGAFYLAEQFNLDILPVLIHGNSEVLPKGDIIIYDGSITVKILDRIGPDNKEFGSGYVERTKKLAGFFRREFSKMRAEIEKPDYFKKMIINSFDYKEPDVIKAVKDDFTSRLTQYYTLNKFIGAKAKILHIANDYGQQDVLLSLQEPQREIVSFIADGQHREVAQTNYIIKKNNIKYIQDLTAIVQNKYDVVLFSADNYGDDLAKITKLTDHIILVNCPDLKNLILNFGFLLEREDDGIIVLNRKIQ